MKPNKAVVKSISHYNKKLHVKWNNEYKYFEIWFKTINGDKLITPVVESIYKEKGDCFTYERLDRRILDWLYSSDTVKHSKKWKWIARKRFDARKQREAEKRFNMFQNIAKDSYNLVNMEHINPLIDATPDFVRPDMQTRSRISCRSAENAKKAFGRE